MDEKLEKPNWKQWLPVYGIYQAAKDFKEGEPSVMTEKKTHPLRFYGSIIYQAASFCGVMCGPIELLLNSK